MQNVSVNLKIEFFQEGELVVASAPALQLTSQGKDRIEAEKNIQELMEIFFEENNTQEKLEMSLQDCGWQKGIKSFVPPREIGSLYTEVKVPIFI